MDEEFQALKKERGNVKGAITRAITTIQKIPKTREYLEEIRTKLDTIPQLLEQFEDVHQRFMNHVDEEGKEEAIAYRQKFVAETEEFEQGLHMWVAGEEDLHEESDEEKIDQPNTDKDPTIAYGESTNIQSDQPEHDVEMQHREACMKLEAVRRAQLLESERQEMELAVHKAQEELENMKIDHQIRLLEKKKKEK